MIDSRLRRPAVFLALVVSLALIPWAFAWAGSLPDFTQLVKQRSPAVVNISTTQKVRLKEKYGLGQDALPDLPKDHPLYDFFHRFLDQQDGDNAPREYDAQSLGSGFVISRDGDVLTNYHVVKDADEIVVRLSDRREFEAKLVGSDERSDIALLKIQAHDLPVVEIGKSSALQVGEWVLAIGSPFGFDHSVTAGIVSAKGRSLPEENYIPFIQTDVAINPGNSGGPLFNMDGQVVGVNSLIYSKTGGFMGLSFSIPIELAMDVVKQLKTKGKVVRGWLGVVIQDVTRDLAKSFDMSKPYGALVAQVLPGSPAAKAGLRAGDVIVEYDGTEIGTSSALPPLVGRTRVGEKARLAVIRDGKHRALSVTIGELPEQVASTGEDSAAPKAPPPSDARLGVTVERLAADAAKQLGLNGGVRVTAVEPGPAADAGLRAGDVIGMLNHQPVRSVREFRKVAESLPAGKPVPMLIYRDDNPQFLALTLSE